MGSSLYYITTNQIHEYETTAPVFSSLYSELQELCKKKPEATLNKAKIGMINRVLEDLKKLLKETPSSKYLDLIREDEVPQYSDVVLMLSQYSAALRHFRDRHYGRFYGFDQWVTREAEAEGKKRSG